MPITSVQTTAVLEVINVILSTTAPRGKRQLAAMFLDLVDRKDWPQYYEVIPEPRCLNNVKASIEKGRYKDALDVYTDLSLVFWNALFYNEPSSQIAADAQTLKTVLETEWKKRSVLPPGRTSPPPSSAQKVHKVAEKAAKLQPPPVKSSPAPTPTPSLKASTPNPASTPARTATPTTQTVPVASTGAYLKPVPIRPRSALQESIDMDVDIMSSGAEGQDDEFVMERDPDSEELIKQLEKGLPRWPGFGDKGWMEDVSQERIIEIVHAIKGYKDIIGNRIVTALESVPEESNMPYLSYTTPLSIKLVESRARSKSYATSKEFDVDMLRLFEKARRWHKPCTEPYGRVLFLQRLYQELTSPHPPPGPPYHTTTNFASLRAGPGTIKPVHGTDGEGIPGVTTGRIISKDRTFINEIHYKGWTIKLADWLHLSNPDDPSRPIIGQVFKCWTSEEPSKKGQQGLTVAWYYRPEQTFHSTNRTFWEGEVFKTSHFADHPIEDIIEKVACQFTARHIRGRPRPPSWYIGFPLYVCDSRYNDRERVFVKIKNWNSCVPEDVRKSADFMPIYPFERTVMPNRLPSPFLGKSKSSLKGPGGIIDEKPDDDKGDAGSSRKRLRRSAADGVPNKLSPSSAQASNATGTQQFVPAAQQHQPHMHRPTGPDRSVITAAGGMTYLSQNAQVEKLPPATTKHFDRDPDTNEVLWFPAPPVDTPRPAETRYSMAYLQFLAAKRKAETTTGSNGEPALKRTAVDVRPTVTEAMRTALKDMTIPLR